MKMHNESDNGRAIDLNFFNQNRFSSPPPVVFYVKKMIKKDGNGGAIDSRPPY